MVTTLYMNDAQITIKVHPNRTPTRFRGERDGRLVFDVGAPPEQGKANAELVRFLARALRVPRAAVEIVAGATSGIKRVRIAGRTAAEVAAALAAL